MTGRPVVSVESLSRDKEFLIAQNLDLRDQVILLQAEVARLKGSATPEMVLTALESFRRRVSDRILAELVCCDAYERGNPSHPHKICYWGGAAARLVKEHPL